jgi:hypothetical protein
MQSWAPPSSLTLISVPPAEPSGHNNSPIGPKAVWGGLLLFEVSLQRGRSSCEKRTMTG